MTGIEMVDCEQTLLRNIARKEMKRRHIAQDYWFALRSSERDTIDWAKVNTAIMDRWSFSGLTYIKELAWKADFPSDPKIKKLLEGGQS